MKVRPSVVGKWTSSICMAESCSEHRAWGQAGSFQAQFVAQGRVDAEGQEGDEDMGLDAVAPLMEDGTHGEIALEIFESFLDLGQQHVELPDLRGILRREIGAQQVAAFPAQRLRAICLCAAHSEARRLWSTSMSHQSPGLWRLALGRAQLEQRVSRGGAIAWSSPKRAQSFLSWRRRMARSLATRSRERAST